MCENIIHQMKSLSEKYDLLFLFSPFDDNIIVTDRYSEMEFKIKTQEEFEELCKAIEIIRKYDANGEPLL